MSNDDEFLAEALQKIKAEFDIACDMVTATLKTVLERMERIERWIEDQKRL